MNTINHLKQSQKWPSRFFLRTLLILFIPILLILSGCESCNPSRSNFALIGYWDIPAGETYVVQEDIPGTQEVDFIGRVYYPSYDSETLQDVIDEVDNVDFRNIDVAEGEHPLVVFGHGQYGLGYPTNYLGMTNLMEHLASWGYICVSINLDVLQGNWPYSQQGIPQRGELFLHAIGYMQDLNSNASSIFYNHIDVNKIALIGHSRGGGGALSAVNQNLIRASPYPILAAATISPVDFYVDPISSAVPHVSLYGTWDGDLSRGHGHRLWNGGARQADRVFAEVYGANHFHFTDNINYAYETEEITREQHHEISQGLFNAFLSKYVKGQNQYSWPDYLTGEKRVNSVDYYMQYLSNQYLRVDDGSPLGSVTENNLLGTNDGTTLILFNDKMLNDLTEHFYNEHEGLIIHWDDRGDLVEFNFPTQDVSSYSYLSFRVSQRHGFTLLNNLDERKNFGVNIADGAGTSNTVLIENYQGALQYPDLSGSISSTSPYQYKNIMRSYRIPLEHFTGTDFTQINKVTFIFDQAYVDGFDNESGAIALDDLEFSN